MCAAVYISNAILTQAVAATLAAWIDDCMHADAGKCLNGSAECIQTLKYMNVGYVVEDINVGTRITQQSQGIIGLVFFSLYESTFPEIGRLFLGPAWCKWKNVSEEGVESSPEENHDH